MITVQLLEEDDILQPTDYCRPLLLTTTSPQSDHYSFSNTYSGLPENYVKWLRVEQKFGECWYGKPIKNLLAKIEPYEFIRGEIPKSHLYGLTKADIRKEYNDYLATNVMSYGKYKEYTFAEIRQVDHSYFDWATDKEIIKRINYDTYL